MSSEATSYVSRLRKYYNDEVISSLKETFDIKNSFTIPNLEKISLNVSYAPAVTDKKKLAKIESQLSLIAGQKPIVTKARRSLAGFHLREGMPIGLKVTLRKNNMYDFLDKLINISMPRIKDFKAFDDKKFDKYGNFNFGISDHTIFPEINYDDVDFIWGMNVTIVTNCMNKEYSRELLNRFNFPFVKKK